MLAFLTRRSLLALIGLAAAPTKMMAAPSADLPSEVELLICPVAGLAYYDYVRVAASVAAGDGLVLRREPANPHDSRAIEVLTEHGTKLGYVPRVDNAALASLLDAGYALRAEIVVPDFGSRRWASARRRSSRSG